MDGATFHERFRILMHDKGLMYVIPHPFWTPEELTLRAQAAMETLYSMLVDVSMSSPVAVLSRAIKSCSAVAGTTAPDDYYVAIIGVNAAGQYVNADPLAVAAANSGYDAFWTAGGKFYGTAVTAYYYAKPMGPLEPNATGALVDLMFPDAFYDTVITLASKEIVMGEQRDAVERLGLLDELFQDQMQALL